MKSFFLLALTTISSAALALSPECEHWSKRIGLLEIAIATQKDKLKACESNCRETEILLGSYEREQSITKEFLNDPFYGCTLKK